MSANRPESYGLKLLRTGSGYCASVCLLLTLILAADAHAAAKSDQLPAHLQGQLQWKQSQRMVQLRQKQLNQERQRQAHLLNRQANSRQALASKTGQAQQSERLQQERARMLEARRVQVRQQQLRRAQSQYNTIRQTEGRQNRAWK